MLLSPSLQWSEAALRLVGDGRQVPQTELKQDGLWVEPFNSIPETSRSSVKTCTWAI